MRIGSWKLSARAPVAGGGGGSASNPGGTTQAGLGHGGDASRTVGNSGTDGNGQYHGGGGGTATAGGASGGNDGADGLARQGGGQAASPPAAAAADGSAAVAAAATAAVAPPGGGGAGSSHVDPAATNATYNTNLSGGDGIVTIASPPGPTPTPTTPVSGGTGTVSAAARGPITHSPRSSHSALPSGPGGGTCPASVELALDPSTQAGRGVAKSFERLLVQVTHRRHRWT